MPKCPSCNTELVWQSDFMCDEVYGCECEEGIINVFCCSECDSMYNNIWNCENLPTALVKVQNDDDN